MRRSQRSVAVGHGGPARDREHIRWAYPLEDARELPVVGARHPLRREACRWLAWGGAAAVALVLLPLGIWSWWSGRHPATSTAREIKFDRTKFFPGKFGPLRVMPELSIEDGTDARNQEPTRRRAPRKPAPEPEAVAPALVGLPVPPRLLPSPNSFPDSLLADDAELSLVDAVEMHMPAQMNPCFVLDRLVRPHYPLNALPRDRGVPLITVEVAFYVNEEGFITASYVIASTGGPAFDDVVLKSVNGWKFRPVEDPACPPLGFWVRLPVTFRNPQRLRGHK